MKTNLENLVVEIFRDKGIQCLKYHRQSIVFERVTQIEI